MPEDRRYDSLAIDRTAPTKAWVTIMEGCNKNCTFCIVPTTRGREVSRTFDEILTEVQSAVSRGHVEIDPPEFSLVSRLHTFLHLVTVWLVILPEDAKMAIATGRAKALRSQLSTA